MNIIRRPPAAKSAPHYFLRLATPGFFFAAAFFCFPRQRRREIDGARHPLLQTVRGPVAVRRDADIAGHDAPAHLNGGRVRFPEDRGRRVRSHAHQ
jgi:hypothetical protein